ncbi:unnamed protein product [Polarella glacialis]|uniref:Mif2/CENP-C cupin domain-containing protein n=1 Tax=Polarella glacialis TaxID=89957 RepID=A0A813JHI6_POLGL|nr:unnamed protein product [Polarella glacialis]
MPPAKRPAVASGSQGRPGKRQREASPEAAAPAARRQSGGRGSKRGSVSSSRGAREAAAAVPEEGEAVDAETVAEIGRHVVTRAEAETELFNDSSSIGGGTRATVLFHESTFDSAMISLDAGGAEMTESNSTSLEMLYCVVEAEDGQVEFELPDSGFKQRLSKGGEVMVPAGATYALRNLSSTAGAKLLAIVPR